MPPTTPVAVVDALNALLEAEQNAIIRFMGEGTPYLSRACPSGGVGPSHFHTALRLAIPPIR